MSLTTDHSDACLHETDPVTGMRKCYLILDDEARSASHHVRPVRRQYMHMTCGTITTMGDALSETYAANPKFYTGTYCAWHKAHFPVGPTGEFEWVDEHGQRIGVKVGT